MEIDIIVAAMVEKKANDIVVIDFKENFSLLFSSFVICHGNSAAQIDAIVENVDRMMRKKKKIHPTHVEGKSNMEWVLMDYGDIIVHVFNEDSRKFYNLEDLWADAVIRRIE